MKLERPQWLLQRSQISPRRLLGLFFASVCLVTLFLYSKISSKSELSSPVIADIEEVSFAETEHDPSQPLFIAPVNVTISPPVDPITKRANATLVMLCRNSDISGVESSMRSLEMQFNAKYNYPWVFLNEEPFDDEFKSRVAKLTSGEVHFGLIHHDDWFKPDWIDDERMKKGMEDLEKLTSPWPIPYASSISYRNMCRFNSGFFFRHELLKPYKWYWRVEPDVKFTCQIPFDPFVRMIEQNKRYSFTVSLKEVQPTVPTLWDAIKDFRREYPNLITEDNALSFVSNDGGESYNLCHYWSNFEVADLDFFRSAEYQIFFSFLDRTGKFYYERWGDAPVHSIAASLFLPKTQIHFFNEIGYRHPPYEHCPSGHIHTEENCDCWFGDNFDYTSASCLRKFESLF